MEWTQILEETECSNSHSATVPKEYEGVQGNTAHLQNIQFSWKQTMP